MALEIRISAEIVNTDLPNAMGALMGKADGVPTGVWMGAKRQSTFIAPHGSEAEGYMALMRQKVNALIEDTRMDLDTQIETTEQAGKAVDAA